MLPWLVVIRSQTPASLGFLFNFFFPHTLSIHTGKGRQGSPRAEEEAIYDRFADLAGATVAQELSCGWPHATSASASPCNLSVAVTSKHTLELV